MTGATASSEDSLCRKDKRHERRCWTVTEAAASSEDSLFIRDKDEAVERQKNKTENSAESEDSEIELITTAVTTQGAELLTGTLPSIPVHSETQSGANSRGNRRVISTELF